MKLLDTSVLVEIDRGNAGEKVEKLDTIGKHAINQVTVTEMFIGLENRYSEESEKYQEAKDSLEKLLSRFKVIQIDRAISIKAAKITAELKQKGKPVNDLHDTYIAATARKEQLEILTKNVKHFKPVNDVEVQNWEDF